MAREQDLNLQFSGYEPDELPITLSRRPLAYTRKTCIRTRAPCACLAYTRKTCIRTHPWACLALKRLNHMAYGYLHWQKHLLRWK